jgi:hypothetical protein
MTVKAKVISLLVMIAVFSAAIFLVYSNKVDQSLVGNDVCGPPCVADIRPGETSTSDALQILKVLGTHGGEYPIMLDSGIIHSKLEDADFYLYSKDNLINYIDTRLNSTKLNEVINLFGQPSYVDRGKFVDGYSFVSLLYPEKGLLFVAGGNKELYRVESDMNVVKAVFSQPSDVTTMINTLYGKEIIEETLLNIQKRHGYGDY